MFSVLKNDFFQLFSGGFVAGAIALLTLQPGV